MTPYAPMPTQRVIAREGYPFIAICLLLSLVSVFLGWVIPTIVFLFFLAFVIFFFRNPEREIPEDSALILSPADGRVIFVGEVEKAPLLEGKATKVSIFMSIIDVHVNRVPISATVKEVKYRPGKFFVASLDKASEYNESHSLLLEDGQGRKLTLVQIAGVIARRIVCYIKAGDFRKAGERLGLIRFGSRLDIYVQVPHQIDVKVGDKVKGGSSIIGRWR